jgi:hypothetical protein
VREYETDRRGLTREEFYEQTAAKWARQRITERQRKGDALRQRWRQIKNAPISPVTAGTAADHSAGAAHQLFSASRTPPLPQSPQAEARTSGLVAAAGIVSALQSFTGRQVLSRIESPALLFEAVGDAVQKLTDDPSLLADLLSYQAVLDSGVPYADIKKRETGRVREFANAVTSQTFILNLHCHAVSFVTAGVCPCDNTDPCVKSTGEAEDIRRVKGLLRSNLTISCLVNNCRPPFSTSLVLGKNYLFGDNDDGWGGLCEASDEQWNSQYRVRPKDCKGEWRWVSTQFRDNRRGVYYSIEGMEIDRDDDSAPLTGTAESD